MTIQYYVGGKIVGLSSDTKPTLVPANTTFIESDTFTEFIFDGVATWNQIGAPLGAVGGWVEVGRTTLTGTADEINVLSIPDKRYYMILYSGLNSGTINPLLYLGNGTPDTGSNYARRFASNGGGDITDPNSTFISSLSTDTDGEAAPEFSVGYISNLTANEKLGIFHTVARSTAGAGVEPNRRENVGKWTNTSNVMDNLRVFNSQTGDFDTGSEVVVLGWDPTDTHTTNFWEELASVELVGANSNISSGIIPARKYLWIQSYLLKSSTATANLTFNNVTAAEYSDRISDDGGADFTNVNQSFYPLNRNSANPYFSNIFIINNLANQKLIMHHDTQPQNPTAADSPLRREEAGKWANTSAQITEIDIDSSTSTFATGTILKVWGSN